MIDPVARPVSEPASSRFAALLRRFRGDRRAVAAIEFALVAPLLLSLYFLTMEVSQGIETNKKVGRTASMTADLITQLPQTNKSELQGIMQVGSAVIQPYNRTKPTVTITAIEITDEAVPKVKVAWSRKMANDAFSAGLTKGTIVTIPVALKIKGTFLIRVTTELAYKPVIVWTAQQKADLGMAAAFDNIGMSETYYLRPRVSTTIPCTDC